MSRAAPEIDGDTLAWPVARLGEAVELLARRGQLTPRLVDIPVPPPDVLRAGEGAVGRWLEAAALWLGLEAAPVDSPYADVDRLLRGAAPALLAVSGAGGPRFLALLAARRGQITVLGPDRTPHQVPLACVRAALCRDLEAPLASGVDQLLDDVGVAAARRPAARAAILREQLSAARIGGCWVLRLPPGADRRRLGRASQLTPRVLGLLGLYTVVYLLEILGWWLVGAGALSGHLDRGLLLGWALVLLSQIPVTLGAGGAAGRLAIDVGVWLKARLLVGALRLDPGEIRQQGAGQLLGRVFESEAVESLALSSGFQGLVAGIELILALVILATGAGGPIAVILLLAWLAVAGGLGRRFYQYRQRWTHGGRATALQAGRRVGRLGMTHDLIERMVGHRTRLAQEAPERWHAGEDEALERYLALGGAMDRARVLLNLVPRGWLIVGLLGLAPAFVSGQVGPAPLAVGLGGVLLAYRALGQLTNGLTALASAAIAWQQVAPLYQAAGRVDLPGLPEFALAPGPAAPPGADQPVLDAQDLSFRYAGRPDAVLHGCSLRIAAGDRILLEGASGGGKSTLAALLIGLRAPQSGLLLLGGLDRQTLGAAGWRRRVCAAPQFHENHVLTSSFAFNLLMGRRWPPTAEDLAQAAALCRALGLGDVLDRMPAGLLQLVGETGWQLSHGERSRLYIARALLQDADVVILDESFAALDPETLQRCLQCVLARAATLVVIAHP